MSTSLAALLIDGPRNYISRALDLVNVVGGLLIAGMNYWLFPDHGLMVALGCVLAAALLDICTRYMAVRKTQGKGHWRSERFWEGTGVKLVAYLVIAFLAGLSYRLAPFMQQPTVFLWSVAYVVMFLREVQSNMENLADMGADVGWLKAWARRQEDKLLQADDFMGASAAMQVTNGQHDDEAGWEEP